MRLSFPALLLAGIFAATAGAANAAPAGTANTAAPKTAPQCLKIRDIQSSKSNDGRVMTFVMKDGTTLYNQLQGVCPGLKFNGFAWVIRGGSGEVCAQQQSLRVLQSGEICVLGKFSTTKPKISTDKM